VKPSQPQQLDSQIKKTRQAKDKVLQKKNSAPAPAKAPQPPATPIKKPTRALVTKPPIIDDEPATSKHLKIKIKKISKASKPAHDVVREK
jgi:hypothetical protein